jgi:5-(aminomethyl)-3-furanmethanol phosphate kinase
MIVVKLGGSHACSALLGRWLVAIEAARGEAVIVPGGGPFADAVRAAQPAMQFSDKAAHDMALLAMTQYAVALTSLRAVLVLADSRAALEAALSQGRVPVWSPWPMLRDAAGIAASWDVTSDSLSLWLARTIAAPRVLFVKRRRAPAGTGARQLAAAGLLDAASPGWLEEYRGAVYLAGPEDVPTALDPRNPPGRRIACREAA